METTPNFGAFEQLTPTTVLPEIKGVRIIECPTKGKTVDGKYVPPKIASSYTLIPDFITEEAINERMDDLTPHFIEYLYSVVRADIQAQHKAAATKIYTEYLDMDKVIELLEATNTSSRLSGEQITAYFTEYLADTYQAMLLTNAGVDHPTEEQLAKLELLTNKASKMFSSLAGPNTILVDADKEAAKTLLELADAKDHLIGRKLLARLEAMDKKKESVLGSL